MFDQILVPMDRSFLAEYILPHVTAMAQAYASTITLISVLDPAIGSTADRPTDPFDWRMQRGEAELYLTNVSTQLKSRGLSVQTILLEGKAPDQVIGRTKSIGADLIMLSSHGQGGSSVWNRSSVVTKIIQQAHTSIMVIQSSPGPERSSEALSYRRILAPVDGSRRAEYGLSAAVSLARNQDAELVIAHVIKPPELPRRTPLSIQDQALIQKVVESNRVEGSLYLDNLRKSLNCQVDTRLIIAESVTEALYSLTTQEAVDLVVLNAHGLGGNPHRPYGNVTTNFLSYSTIPLLIVQDFKREQLVQVHTGVNDKKHWSQQRPVSTRFGPKLEAVTYQELHAEDRAA